MSKLVVYKAFNRICDEWELTKEEREALLGSVEDRYERAVSVVRIAYALECLIANPGWVRRPNSAPLFNGEPALNKLMSPNLQDLIDVRQYLEAVLYS